MRLKYLSALSVLAFAAALPMTVSAGFEFIAPGAKSTTRPAAIKTDMPVVPVEDVASAPLEPMPSLTGDRRVSLSDPLLGPAPVGLTPLSQDPVALKIDDTPSAVATKPSALPPSLDIPGAEPMPSNFPSNAAPLPPSDDNATVQGFGNKVTLAMALQQIVPSSYRYSFDAGVNPGMKITWSGGKPWKQIVGDIARTNRLNVDIVSNVVAFRLKTAPSPVTTDIPATVPAADISAAYVPPMDVPAPDKPMALTDQVARPMPADTGAALEAPTDTPPMAKTLDETPAVKASIIPEKPKSIEMAPSVTDDAVASPAPAINDTAVSGSNADDNAMPAPIIWSDTPDVAVPAAPLNDSLFDQPTMSPNANDRRVLGSIKDESADESIATQKSADAPNPVQDDMAPMPTSELAAPSIDTPTEDQLFETIPDDGQRTSSRDGNMTLATADTPGQQKKKLQLIDVSLAAVENTAGGFAQAMLADDTPKLTTGSGMVVTAPTDNGNLGPGPEPLDLLNKDPDPVTGKSLNNNIISSSQLPPDNAAPATIQGLPDVNATRQWTAQKNETLRQTLTRWSESAGVSLVWSSEYDYPLQTDLRMDATYPQAVRTILGGFSKAQPRPLGRFFKNSQGGASPVLIIETQRLTD